VAREAGTHRPVRPSCPCHAAPAILDDNDALLAQRLTDLRDRLPDMIASRACAAVVIGSVAEGCARDASDLDLLLVLREGSPCRADYRWWDAAVEPQIGATARFPVAPLFVGRSALGTGEPKLRSALDRALVLWDPEGLFDDQSHARA
jgi:hypothetical protein